MSTKASPSEISPARDVESQQQKVVEAGAKANVPRDDNAGKGLGIAMFVLLIIAFIFMFLFPIVSFVCIIATIVISSVATCGCCCASNYNLKPNVHNFALATLTSLCLMLVVQLILIIVVSATIANDSNPYESLSSTEYSYTSLVVAWVVSLVLNIAAIVFSALFTWGRGVCAPKS